MHDGNEQVIWEGRPSQVINFNQFLIAALVPWLHIPLASVWGQNPYPSFSPVYQALSWAVVVLPVGYAFVLWLRVRLHRYRLTTERFTERYGIINTVTEDLELYRVRDTTIYEPLSLRMFGCGNVVLYTSDSSSPVIAIRAVQNVEQIQAILRSQVEAARASRGVVELG